MTETQDRTVIPTGERRWDSSIPCECNASDEQLAAMRFTLGPRISSGSAWNQGFREADYPAGWDTRAGGHRWDHLIDDRGRTRAVLFYGDRHDEREALPFLQFVKRFTVKVKGRYYPDFDDSRPARASVVLCDAGRPVRCFGVVEFHDTAEPGVSYEVRRVRRLDSEKKLAEVQILAYAWLRDHYPGYESWSAHWDDPAVEPDESINSIPAGSE